MTSNRSKLIALPVAAVMAATSLVALSGPASATPTCRTPDWGSLSKSESDYSAGTIERVRIGRHDCFDRIVFDLDGQDAGYRVEYVSEVEAPGSGNRVPVDGGATIRIIINAPGYKDGKSTVDIDAVNNLDVRYYHTFKDIEWAGSFEGSSTIALGTRARLPFRVFTLDSSDGSSRLVVDVAHYWTDF